MGDDLKKKMGLKPPDSGLTEEESRQMEKRLKEGEMSFDDFLKQVQVMQKAAGLQSMLAKGPFGGGQQVSEEQVKEGQKKLTRYGEYVGCMDGIERANPKLLIDEAMSLKQGNSRATAPRLQRIAEASGATLDDVGRFVMEFNVMRTAAVRFARGDSPEDIKKGMMAEQMAGGAAPNRKQRRMADKKAKSPTAAKRGFAPPPPKVPSEVDRPVPTVPRGGTSTRPGRLFDTEPIDPASVPSVLLTKPDPVFFGERDDKKREGAATEEFALTVHYDALTSGLESEPHFRVEEKQIIAGRYVVIQYLGSGTFCHTVQCEDLRAGPSSRHRFVCVKVSKNTKDILDQNLWEVKLLKLLSRRIDSEQRALLPALLNVFYYRETLFIVYELLRDNLYHIYKYIEECALPKYFTCQRLREVARQCLQTLAVLHAQHVIHCDLKPENILIQSLTACQVKVIDYGNAYLHHDQRCSYVQSRAYRAPEVVLGHAYSTKVDLWSFGCILMELLTNRLLFDNRSVQSLLASHIALLGPFPKRLVEEGQLSEYYFEHMGSSSHPQTLVGKHDGRLCRMKPTSTSLEALCERHGADDPNFASFIRQLLALDPVERATAEKALQHPFLRDTSPCPPYKLTTADRSGEAGQRLLHKYRSLENVESPTRLTGSASFPSAIDAALLNDDDVPGPATPTSFREQCYIDRERLEKKRSRKSGASRWGGSSNSKDEPPANLDGMALSPDPVGPKTPASTDPLKKGRA